MTPIIRVQPCLIEERVRELGIDNSPSPSAYAVGRSDSVLIASNCPSSLLEATRAFNDITERS
jgi:hypothetical protein